MSAYLGFRQPKARRQSAVDDVASKLASVDAAGAHRGEGRRQVALGEPPAVLMHDQRVVEVTRLGQAEKRLQKPLHGRRRPEVRGANHQAHAAGGIVDDAGEVLARRRVLSCQDLVVDVTDRGGEAAAVLLGPDGEADALGRFG